MSIEVFLDRLDGVKKNRRGWKARCPVHDDHDPSLSIDLSPEGNILVICRVCEANGKDVAEKLGIPIGELFAKEQSPAERDRPFRLGNASRRHPYRDETGTVLCTVAMFGSGASREVRPFLPEGKQGYGDRRILYRLDELVNSTGPVYVVEGEKDVDRLASLGLTATTNPMGAGKFKYCDSTALEGRDVIVLGDNDDVGRKHVADVMARLAGRAASIRIIDLPDLHPKGDVSDWLNEGHTLEELEALVEASGAPESQQTTEAAPADRDLRHTDVDNSTRLVQIHGDQIRYVPKWARWLVWRDHTWNEDPDRSMIGELAKDVSSDLYRQAAENPDAADKIASWAGRSASAHNIESMVKLARGIDGIPVEPDDLDRDPWLLGVANGVIDLRTGNHHPGDPDDLMTRQAPVAYDFRATCPTWDRCMREWFPDADTRAYVQRLAGSVLVGKQVDHRFIIHYGDGGNGKGTFMRAISHILGDYYVVPAKSLIVTSKHSGNDETAKAHLFRARLAVADEAENRQRLNEATIKNLTGDDLQHARRLYGHPFNFTPTHSLWLTTNHMPEIRGVDHGIWRRIEVLPWVAKFEGGNEDRELGSKLQSESAGILNWLITGALEWQRKNGLHPSTEVLNRTAEYRASEDVLGRFAQDTGLSFTDGLHATSKQIRDELEDWCTDQGIEDHPSANKVAEWLKAGGAVNLGSKRRNGIKGTWWRNVGFLDNEAENVTQQGKIHEDVHPVNPLPATSPTHTRKGTSGEGMDGVDTSPAEDGENPGVATDSAHSDPVAPRNPNPKRTVAAKHDLVARIGGSNDQARELWEATCSDAGYPTDEPLTGGELENIRRLLDLGQGTDVASGKGDERRFARP